MYKYVFECGCNLKKEDTIKYQNDIYCKKHKQILVEYQFVCEECLEVTIITKIYPNRKQFCLKCRFKKEREAKRKYRLKTKYIKTLPVPKKREIVKEDCRYYYDCLSIAAKKNIFVLCQSCNKYLKFKELEFDIIDPLASRSNYNPVTPYL